VTVIYCRENGYGTVNTMEECFQVGRRLSETQRELSKPEALPPDVAKLREVAHWYCQLVANLGPLRADYSSLQEVLKGNAVYEYEEGGLCYRVRRECLGKGRVERCDCPEG
jgi:hypothetical protein